MAARASRPRPAGIGTTLASERRIPQHPAFCPNFVTDMKTPVRFSRVRSAYTGRMLRTSFDEWAASREGLSALNEVASQTFFALFGRRQAARSQVWKQLRRAARTETVALIAQRELDEYLPHLGTLVFARELPRVAVDLHRLVVVPRMFVNGQAYRRIDTAIRTEPEFAELEGGDSLCQAFAVTLVDSIAAAIAAARPSPEHPLSAGDEWIAVGVNEQFEWRVPFDGPAWPGHYFVLELTRTPITRAVRKTVAETTAHLEASLASLTPLRRSEILRQAASSLEPSLAHA